MKEPKEFKAQLPAVVASAFEQRHEPVPRAEVIDLIVAGTIAILEQAAGGNPVPSMAPLVVIDKLLAQIVGLEPLVAKSLADSGHPAPSQLVLLEVCSRQVMIAVQGQVGVHGAELALLLRNSQVLDA